VIDAQPLEAPAEAAMRGARYAAWRFVLQRASAAVLALCVVVHLATIIYAVRHALSAQAIVGRMHANVLWPAFYTLFVVPSPSMRRSVFARSPTNGWDCAAAQPMSFSR
jgi:hypothetical protein